MCYLSTYALWFSERIAGVQGAWCCRFSVVCLCDFLASVHGVQMARFDLLCSVTRVRNPFAGMRVYLHYLVDWPLKPQPEMLTRR